MRETVIRPLNSVTSRRITRAAFACAEPIRMTEPSAG
jgi:hypothetical protein